MTAAEAAVHVMASEGVNSVFGLPGAAINPLYAALRKNGEIIIVAFVLICAYLVLRSLP